jgi:CRP/FNR family transcriptional regulator, cyclic AMP receptor protein
MLPVDGHPEIVDVELSRLGLIEDPKDWHNPIELHGGTSSLRLAFSRDTASVEELLALADGLPRRSLARGEVLLVDGEPVHALYVLLSGALRIEKGGTLIAVVAERGTCVGEMSLLLDNPATADVVAEEDAVVAVVEDARAALDDEGSLTLALARLLAARLQVMTSYLADLKHQYADHEGGLGMVDTVLGSLLRSPGPRTVLRSEREPEPEY